MLGKKNGNNWLDVILSPAFRNVLIAFLSIALTTVAAVFPVCLWLIIILAILNILATAFYSRFDKKYYTECQQLESKIKSYEDALRRINSVCRTSAQTVNKQIHGIQNTGKYDPNSWNFQMACKLTCEQCYETLSILLAKRGKRPDIGVGYVRLVESDQTNSTVSLCAYHQYSNHDKIPSILNVNRDINDIYAYHDATLFLDQKDEPDLLLSLEAVQEKFQFHTGSNRKKYKQYVAVPVFCDKDTETKMVGLLEVCCFENNCFPNDPVLVESYVDDIIRPYAYIVLMLHKMEKALLTVPRKDNTSNGGNEG